MKGAVIVDTSVWINFLRGKHCKEVAELTNYLENDWPIYLCPTIVQEVLQGVTDDLQFAEITEYLLAFEILPDDPLEMAVRAAKLYRSVRKQGNTIRKSNDCLIASYAIKHGMEILHQDRDLDLIRGEGRGTRN
jgi:predicted nucleic acid-binding protein